MTTTPTAPSNNAPQAASLSAIEQRRLERLARWLREGQAAAVELELHEWSRQPRCPDAALVILAGLLAQRGEHDAARDKLRPVHTSDDRQIDPMLAQALLAELMHAEMTDAAQRLARRLHTARGEDEAIKRWLRVMCVPGQEELPDFHEATADRLAEEITQRPDLIPTLVYAQKLEPRLSTVNMLRRALAQAAEELAGDEGATLNICTALAELALLIGDDDSARRWAHRGLKLDRYNATLALVLSKVTDDPGVGEPARAVLARVAKRRPTYPDVRAALIRREALDGQDEAARMRLEQWLATEPESAIARGLNRELAA